jgi:alpha-1,6-mannosyltransferase
MDQSQQQTKHQGPSWLPTVGLLALATGLGTICRYWSSQSDLNSQVPEFIALALLAGVLYLCGVYLVENFPLGLPALLIIFAGAVVFRLYLLPLDPPPLSDDVYRYQWDGRVERAHINPYTVTPALPAVGRFEDRAHPIQTARDIPTVYPPLSEFVFSWVSTVSGYKRLFTGFDLATVVIILLMLAALKMPLHWVLTYAWNPTVIAAFAMCGHHDSLAIFTLATASFLIISQRRVLSSIFLALSFLSKFFPGALLPVFLATVQRGRRERTGPETVPGAYDRDPEPGNAALRDSVNATALSRPAKPIDTLWPFVAVFTAVVLAGYLPYARAGRSLFAGLSKYAAIWEANDSFFRLLLLAGNSRDQAKLIAGVALLGLLVYVLKKRMELLRACLFVLAGVLVLSSNAFPWYFTWSIPFLCFYPAAPWLLMSVTSVLGYAPVVAYAAGQPYVHSPFILALEYFPVYLWLCYLGWREVRRDRGPNRSTSAS